MKNPTSNPIEIFAITDFSADLEPQIRERAYELYEQRGRQDKLDLDDWLQAESEILGKAPLANAA